jgi:hypothetical protein
MHGNLAVWHQQDMQQQRPVRVCSWYLRFQLCHLQWYYPLLLVRRTVRSMHGCLAVWHQQDMQQQRPVRVRKRHLRFQLRRL